MLLSRYSGEDDGVCATRACRHTELKDMVDGGTLYQHSPVRVQVEPDSSLHRG